MLILRPQTGLSLVELLIAIAIMGILMAGALPSFGSWMQNSQIRTAAESVLNGLQLARSEAARANASVSFTLSGNDWSVAISGVASAVQSRSGREGSPNAVITSTQNTVTFNGTGRVTPTPATDITLAVTNPQAGNCTHQGGSARCLNVVVRPGGQVRMCDPALSLATNPQGC